MTEEKTREQELEDRLRNEQFKRVFDKLDTINAEVTAGFRDVRKVLEDYEDRLRRQANKDIEQGKEIHELGLRIRELTNDVSSIKETLATESTREINRWEELKWTLIKVSVVGLIILGLTGAGSLGITKLLMGLV